MKLRTLVFSTLALACVADGDPIDTGEAGDTDTDSGSADASESSPATMSGSGSASNSASNTSNASNSGSDSESATDTADISASDTENATESGSESGTESAGSSGSSGGECIAEYEPCDVVMGVDECCPGTECTQFEDGMRCGPCLEQGETCGEGGAKRCCNGLMCDPGRNPGDTPECVPAE